MKEKLKESKDKLEYIISTLGCANVAGANASLQQAKMDAIHIYDLLEGILAELDSPELAEKIADAQFEAAINFDYRPKEDGTYDTRWMYKETARAAIEAIIGE